MCGVSIEMQGCSMCVQGDKGKGGDNGQRGNEQELEQTHQA